MEIRRCSSTCGSASGLGGLAEVGADHGGILLDHLRRSLGDLLAEVEHDDAITRLDDERDVVLDHDDGDASAAPRCGG